MLCSSRARTLVDAVYDWSRCGTLPVFDAKESPRGANRSTQYVGSFAYESPTSGDEETVKLEVGLREPLVKTALRRPARSVRLNPVTGKSMVAPVAAASIDLSEAYAEKFRAALTRRDVATRGYYDNLNTHRNTTKGAFVTEWNRRHGSRFFFHYTPTKGSWLNQVELRFGIVGRRILRYGNFRSPDEFVRAMEAFIEEWNRTEAHAFRWTYEGLPLVS